MNSTIPDDILIRSKRRRGPLLIHTTRMWRGGGYCVSVWELTQMMCSDSRGHSTITTFDNYPKVWWGRVGTRRLPKWIDDVPAKGASLDERIRLVMRHYDQQVKIAKLAVKLSGVAGTEDCGAFWDGSELRYVGDNGDPSRVTN